MRFLLPFSLVLAVAIAVALSAKIWPWAGWSIFALLLFAVMLEAMRRTSPRALVLASPILLLWATELFSGALIEHGAYLVETQRRGSATGGFAVLATLYMCFAAAMAAIIERLLARLDADEMLARLRVVPWFAGAIGAVFVLTSAYAALVGVQHGFPLLTGADRLTFRAMLDDRIFEAWHSNRIILAFLFGMIAAGGWRSAGLFMLVALSGLSILFSEKFTSLLMMLCAFAMVPGLVRIARSGRLPLSRTMAPVAVLLLLSVPATFAVYGGFDRAPRAWAQMESRMALQGQAWHIVEAGAARAPGPGLSVLAEDAKSWIDLSLQNPESAGTRHGHYYVMRNIAPRAVLDDFYTNGVGFVFLLFPYLYLLGGLWATLLGGLFLCATTAIVLALLALSAGRQHHLSTIICLKLLVWQISGFILGSLWFFVGIKTAALLVLLGIATFLHSALARQQQLRRVISAQGSMA